MWRKYPLAWLLFSLLSCPCAAMINPLHWELPLDLEPPTALPTKAFSLLAEASPQENNRELISEIKELTGEIKGLRQDLDQRHQQQPKKPTVVQEEPRQNQFCESRSACPNTMCPSPSEKPECVRFSCACVGRHPRSSNGRSTVAYPSEYSFFDEVL